MQLMLGLVVRLGPDIGKFRVGFHGVNLKICTHFFRHPEVLTLSALLLLQNDLIICSNLVFRVGFFYVGGNI